MVKITKFTKALLVLLSLCCIISLVPLLVLTHVEHKNLSLPLSTSSQENSVNLETLTSTDILEQLKVNNIKEKEKEKEKEKINDDETLIPINSIPISPYYSFDPKIMPRSFLRSLQNSSRRIIKKWFRSGFNRYENIDILNCDKITPECTLHKYLLPYSKEKEDPNILPYRKCCVEHKALRETIIWVVKKLKLANITYFLSTGTALGAKRHSGVIIPWDTDVDIAVYPNDKIKIEQIFKGNKEHYFRKDRNGKPMFWIYHSKNGEPPGGPHVEIFYDPIYTQFPHLLLPLEECLFYDEPMICPNIKQFDEWFPSGWKIYGGGHYNGPNNCIVRENGIAIAKKRC